LSLVLGLFSIIALEAVAILIAVFIGIPTLITQVKARPKEEEMEREQESRAEEKEILCDETIRVGPNDSSYYEFELSRGENVRGEISSDIAVDIYFVDKTNFKKWERDRSFNYEDSNESVLEAKIDYVAPRKGAWHLLIENNGRKSAKVKVRLY